MFARRYSSVVALLTDLERTDPTAGALRWGLSCRTEQVLREPQPRALRVRALADFYYSQGALLHHRARGGPVLSVAELVAQALPREVAPGVEHCCVEGLGPAGPIHANVLRAGGVRLRVLDARGSVDLASLVAEHGAIAGTSGGFFLYSEPDIVAPARRGDPVGLLVEGGLVRGAPTFRRSALVQHADGRFAVQTIGMSGVTVRSGEEAWTVSDGGAVQAHNRAAADRSPPSTWAVAVAGGQVIATGPGPLPIPLAGFVLSLQSRAQAQPGDPVEVHLPHPHPQAAMAGGPRLLGDGPQMDLAAEDFQGSAPPVTFSKDETYDQNLLPRMAAGVDGQGRLVLTAIDGRHFHRAPGMTLGMTAELMRALGCVEAMNLDGGSSKRMVVEGRVVDLPSTEVSGAGPPSNRIRPVHTALLLLPIERQ
jgi:hypothetical protein